MLCLSLFILSSVIYTLYRSEGLFIAFVIICRDNKRKNFDDQIE